MRPEGKESLVVRQETPWNAEPPKQLLGGRRRTPYPAFFVRNHAPVPAVDPATFRLRVDGDVERPLALSLDDLRSFPWRRREATLQCAGNRRGEVMAYRPVRGEVAWADEAIGNAEWGGVALADVLAEARPRASARHVAFLGVDRVEKGGETFGFGGSVPVGGAGAADALLALEMNGEPLPPVHGFPLRAVVPGTIAARSVKWLAQVTLRHEPSENHFQRRAYRWFPPDVAEGDADWDAAPMLDEMPVSAVAWTPRAGTELVPGTCEVAGYAVTGGDRTVVRVEVSADGGVTWRDADLEGDAPPGVWRLWRTTVDLASGDHELVVRAEDSAGRTQPASVAETWNFKGYVNNCWHRVPVRVL